MIRPVGDLLDAVYRDAVVLTRRASEADGVDLIEYTFVRPHSECPPYCIGYKLLYHTTAEYTNSDRENLKK